MVNPEYREVLITYIDILGFREMVKESEKNSAQIFEIHRILRVLKRQIGKRLTRSVSFSDLTVRTATIDRGDNFAHHFLKEVRTLADAQYRLACRYDGNAPILLRGGMTLGLLSPNRKFLFGPALVRAYELENAAAIFPRIVIDPKVIKEAAEHDSKIRVMRDRISTVYKHLVRLGEDGVYFVDYLSACKKRFSRFGPPLPLSMHKHMIQTQLVKLKKAGARERVIQKYLWLANYHNLKVKEIRGIKAAHRKALYISEDLLNLLK